MSSTPTTTTSTSSRPNKRGALIVFEGLDRSGKSTQVSRLRQKLENQGHKVKQIGFPDRTSSTGILINSYLTQRETKLSDEAIHLLFSANRWEKAEEIKRDLNQGTTIICDRYAFSGIAFSHIKGLSWDWCKSPDIGLPLPDLILFLSISSQTAQLRSGYGQERYETSEIQNKVRKVFEKMATQEFSSNKQQGGGGRGRGKEEVWKEISAEGEVEQVEEKIWLQVEELWRDEDERLEKPVGKLWVDEN
ncbi:hypothetical protein JCM3765_002811 [Sporobolomyces pararoseus]